MAQRHVDIDYDTDFSVIASAANAETLTNSVRVTYDDANSKVETIDAIRRVMEFLIEEL